MIIAMLLFNSPQPTSIPAPSSIWGQIVINIFGDILIYLKAANSRMKTHIVIIPNLLVNLLRF